MKKLKYILLNILFIGLISALFISEPASAEPMVDLCGDGAEAAETIRIIFVILSVLGPVFGTLFWVGLSVADAASMDSDYSEKKRKVIIAGFSVPIAIAFFSIVADELVRGADVDCFFPGYEEE